MLGFCYASKIINDMSRIAIMQPYIFPYVGYFQLIAASDQFVFYNDVNFIKKGWIHRNRILLNGKDFLFTIPCAEISQNKLICETKIAFAAKDKNKLLLTIHQAYKNAPLFDEVYSLIEKIIFKEFKCIDELAIHSVKEICTFLNIKTKFLESKGRYNNDGLKKGDRLIDICLKENSFHYINTIGGKELYDKEDFMKSGVELQFMRPKFLVYKQFDNNFVPWLSIIDVLMFNDVMVISSNLNNYELE